MGRAASARQGVYIFRRDTSSRLNQLVGGRLVPGGHYRASFRIHETASSFKIAMTSDDGQAAVAVRAQLADNWPDSSVFHSAGEAAAFFAAGAVGYSPAPAAGSYHGLELRCHCWNVEPLAVESLRSSFMDDPRLLPPGSVEFDSAFLMRGVPHEWHACRDLCCWAAPPLATGSRQLGVHANEAFKSASSTAANWPTTSS
jgi:hypothetical protein